MRDLITAGQVDREGQQAVHRRRQAVLWALVVLLAAGCQARIEVGVVVDADGAGQLSVALSADAALLGEARDAGADPLSDLAATGETLEPAGWRTVDVTDGQGTRTVTVSTSFADPEEFGELARDLTEALAAPELVPLEDLALELTDEQIRISGVAALQPTQAVTELGVQPEQAVAIMRDGEHLELDVSAALPGEVLQTNGLLDEGGRITWTVLPGERVELLAVGKRPGGNWWILASAGLAAGVVALGLLGLLGLLRRSRAAHGRG